MGKEGKEEKRKTEKGQRIRNGKDDGKIKKRTLNWSVPPHCPTFIALGELYAPTNTTHTKPHSQKKSPKSLVLVLHGADVQEIVLSGCLNMSWHQLTSSLLLGKAATEGQPHMHGSSLHLLGQLALYLYAAGTRIKILSLSPPLSYLAYILLKMTKDQWYDTCLQSSRDRSPMERVNIVINYSCLQAS